MCITEDKLVESYGKATPRERFRLIYKNYSIFPQLVDCYEIGLFNRILFEVEYNRRKKNDDDLGVRIQTSHRSDPTAAKAIEHIMICDAIEECNFSGNILKETDAPEKHKRDILTIHMMRREYEAGLVEAEIGGKKCLIRTDIDWDQVDEKGRTNTQRVERELAPLDKNGDSIQLHHIGQHKDSPLAELTFEEHRCGGNDTILHDKSIESEAHGEGNNWDNERQNYWQNRADYNNNGGQET